MAEVFLCRTGQLTAASRRELKKAGVVVVEVDDPTACQFIRSTEAVSADDMLWSTLDALNVRTGYGGDHQRERLAQNLFAATVETRRKTGQLVWDTKS